MTLQLTHEASSFQKKAFFLAYEEKKYQTNM